MPAALDGFNRAASLEQHAHACLDPDFPSSPKRQCSFGAMVSSRVGSLTASGPAAGHETSKCDVKCGPDALEAHHARNGDAPTGTAARRGACMDMFTDLEAQIPKAIADEFKIREIADGGVRCMRDHGRELILEHSLDDNFLVMDLGRITRLHRAFVEAMPRVRPFYAVKCNPHSSIVRAMAALGCGFDCASAPEIQAALAAGAAPTDMILAHPCKRPVDLRFAATSDVLRMTFDCEDELDKIAETMPHAELVLRIRADDPTAVVSFGIKYGADAADEAPALLAAARRRGLAVVGVSFHVGSGSQAPESFRHAVAAARTVFDAAAALGYKLTLLDIGGGFVGGFNAEGGVEMWGVAEHVNGALADHFPLSEYADVEVIAEPGRYFVEVCVTMFALVHTVKARPDGRQWYYLTDGLHGSLAEIPSGRRSAAAHIVRGPTLPPPTAADRAPRALGTVFGPTLDGWDRIFENVPMPRLRRGDWLQLPDHGAYSTSLSTAFNGFVPANARTFYAWSRAPVDTQAEAPTALHKGTLEGSPDLKVPEERVCLTATPQDLGINCIHAHA